jgi:dephospho-CoA kinase
VCKTQEHHPAGSVLPDPHPHGSVSGLMTRYRHGLRPTIGLIGSIGAGKSTVAGLLARRGALVLDADAIGHRILETDPAKSTIVGRWGSSILSASGAIDRRALGQRVFANPGERSALEAIVHPEIRKAILTAITHAEPDRMIVVDAPLLLEVGWDDLVDYRIVVDAKRSIRERRVFARSGWTAEELIKRELAQMPIAEKRARADAIIENDSDDDEAYPNLNQRIDEILTHWTLNSSWPKK